MLTDIITYIKLPFLKDRELYRSLHHILGFYPRNIHHYKMAILHKSVVVKEEGKRIHNERLEFLGDAILDAVVGHIVFRHFPQKPEGFLTTARSNIVRRQSLNKLAQDIGLDKLIISNFKQQTHNNNVNGNAFEALVGAIYLDYGYGHCVRFVREKIMNQLVNIDKAAIEVNHKSKLIEWGQKHHVEIKFNVKEQISGNSSPSFVAQAFVANNLCGQGKGYSKKESQQNAAQVALQKIQKDREFAIGILAPKELQKETVAPPKPLSKEERQFAITQKDIDIDFSQISIKEKSREEIIADAERQAFGE